MIEDALTPELPHLTHFNDSHVSEVAEKSDTAPGPITRLDFHTVSPRTFSNHFYRLYLLTFHLHIRSSVSLHMANLLKSNTTPLLFHADRQ